MRLTLSLEARANGCSPPARASHAFLGVFLPRFQAPPQIYTILFHYERCEPSHGAETEIAIDITISLYFC
jgi:hypothetical protein